jgi:hypothetical protein
VGRVLALIEARTLDCFTTTGDTLRSVVAIRCAARVGVLIGALNRSVPTSVKQRCICRDRPGSTSRCVQICADLLIQISEFHNAYYLIFVCGRVGSRMNIGLRMIHMRYQAHGRRNRTPLLPLGLDERRKLAPNGTSSDVLSLRKRFTIDAEAPPTSALSLHQTGRCRCSGTAGFAGIGFDQPVCRIHDDRVHHQRDAADLVCGGIVGHIAVW